MSYDYEQQPEFAGPGREPAGATGVRFPEKFGPGTLSGAEYGRAGPGMPRSARSRRSCPPPTASATSASAGTCCGSRASRQLSQPPGMPWSRRPSAPRCWRTWTQPWRRPWPPPGREEGIMIPEAVVITPLLHGSRAINLGNRMFRKRMLPVGSVEYQGRTQKFSRDYLRGLVDAFRDRAYYFCTIQIADASNKHTDCQARWCGVVVSGRPPPRPSMRTQWRARSFMAAGAGRRPVAGCRRLTG
jgi:hypothetical protein